MNLMRRIIKWNTIYVLEFKCILILSIQLRIIYKNKIQEIWKLQPFSSKQQQLNRTSERDLSRIKFKKSFTNFLGFEIVFGGRCFVGVWLRFFQYAWASWWHKYRWYRIWIIAGLTFFRGWLCWHFLAAFNEATQK